MKQLIKTILKEESLKQDLRQSVKDFGWESTASMVGGTEELAKLAFNNDPMEFLNLFNDLDIVRSKERKYWTLFRYEKGNNIMVYDRKNKEVYVNTNEIWLLLTEGFNLNYHETEQLTQRWLSDTYKLKGVITEPSWKLTHDFVE
jgi:hypothetical protein